MGSRPLAKIALGSAIVMIVVSVAGFISVLVLNAFVLDKYNAYGEVPVPGSGSLHLPAGEVTVSLHTLVVGGRGGGGLPVPPLGITMTPPHGVSHPVVMESIGTTTTVNNDAHVRVWMVQIPVEGTYDIVSDGQVGGYINPRLAFGHQSEFGYLIWVFVAMFIVGLVDLALSVTWAARTRRATASAAVARTYIQPGGPVPPTVTAQPSQPVVASYEPSADGARLERLKTLAALRDSGALTEEEFQTEKRRILAL